MRIALLSSQFPPEFTDGIARQNHYLARGLARLGVEVHVITASEKSEEESEKNLFVHPVAPPQKNRSFCSAHENLNPHLDRSFRLFETVMSLHAQQPFDLVNYPLWMGEGFATSQFFPGKTVVNLQTTLLQILELQNKMPFPHQRLLAEIDRRVIETSDGIVADSVSIKEEVARLYGLDWRGKANAVVYLGIPPLEWANRTSPELDGNEVMIPGRLEHRKGTMEIFKLIPRLLGRIPEITIRFVGKDNSSGDGFHSEYGLTYPEYFAREYSQFADRVVFSGYVSDTELSKSYSRARCVLFPSHYESFGITYLEAMRAGKAIVAKDTGGAREIFAEGERDGAILVSPNDSDALAEAVERLCEDDELAKQLGAHAVERFNRSFTIDNMAADTLAFFEQVVSDKAHQNKPRKSRRIFQMMEALQLHDAVSNITRETANVLKSFGEEEKILALFCQEDLSGEVQRLQTFVPRSDDALIAHYWIYNWSINYIRNFKGPKAVYFHNVTPPHYFPPFSAAYEMCERAYVQIPQIAAEFDLILGDSDFDVKEFSRFSSRAVPTMAVYPAFSPEAINDQAIDETLLQQLEDRDQTTFLFVGRISPNKRQDRLIQFLADYQRNVNANSRLFLVGDDKSISAYAKQLRDMVSELEISDSVTFTGTVSQEALRSYYRAADFFLCASEHEGFCLPLIEAMISSLPVIALDTSAVPETMGTAGVLLNTWDNKQISERIEHLRQSVDARARLIRDQHKNTTRFSEDDRRKRLQAACRYLRFGEDHPLFIWRKRGEIVQRPD